MFPLVEIPLVVAHYAPHFRPLFSESEYEHFKKYVSGLIVSENKTIESINRLFVLNVKDQSSLNRFLTNSAYRVEDLQEARLRFLCENEKTKLKSTRRNGGVMSLDDTLLVHYGRKFDDIAKLFDHSTNNYVWAHNLVNLHYSDDQIDYPLYFELWRPADMERLESGLRKAGVNIKAAKETLKTEDPKKWRQYLVYLHGRHKNKAEVQKAYRDKIIIAQDLLEQFYSRHPKAELPLAFDKWFTSPKFCKFISRKLKKNYVAGLKSNEQIILSGSKKITIGDFVERLKAEHLDPNKAPVFNKVTIRYKGNKEVYYCYYKTHNIKGYGRHKLLISCQEQDLSAPLRVFITNCLDWQVQHTSRVGRHRWPVEEYHKEGKAEGLDQYQMRDFDAIEKHIAFVALVYSLLQHARHDDVLLGKLQTQLDKNIDGSLAYWRRTTQAQALWAMLQWVQAALESNQSLEQIMKNLIPAFGLA
jgi:DDE superfamily endonuclease